MGEFMETEGGAGAKGMSLESLNDSVAERMLRHNSPPVTEFPSLTGRRRSNLKNGVLKPARATNPVRLHCLWCNDTHIETIYPVLSPGVYRLNISIFLVRTIIIAVEAHPINLVVKDSSVDIQSLCVTPFNQSSVDWG